MRSSFKSFFCSKCLFSIHIPNIVQLNIASGHSHYAPQPPVITVIEDNYNYSPELIGQPRETEDAEEAEAVQTNFVAHKVNFDQE